MSQSSRSAAGSASLTAYEVIALMLDPDSFSGTDEPIREPAAGPAYRAELMLAAEQSGVDEAVITGRGTIGGRPVAVVVSEYGFLAGSIGRATADRIVDAITRAPAARLPLIVCTRSGGTRM